MDRTQLLKEIGAICNRLQEHALERILERVRHFENDQNEASSDGTGEAVTVAAHYDKFCETFAKLGTSKKDFVGAFLAQRKMNPSTSAEEFLACGRQRR